jgi:hypothetical protein
MTFSFLQQISPCERAAGLLDQTSEQRSVLVPVALRGESRLSNAKNRYTIDTAVAPPPTSAVHLLTELWRTSPAENSPGIPVCQVQHDSFGIRNQLPDLDVENIAHTRLQFPMASHNNCVAGTVKRQETRGCFVRHQAIHCRDINRWAGNGIV